MKNNELKVLELSTDESTQAKWKWNTIAYKLASARNMPVAFYSNWGKGFATGFFIEVTESFEDCKEYFLKKENYMVVGRVVTNLIEEEIVGLFEFLEEHDPNKEYKWYKVKI